MALDTAWRVIRGMKMMMKIFIQTTLMQRQKKNLPFKQMTITKETWVYLSYSMKRQVNASTCRSRAGPVFTYMSYLEWTVTDVIIVLGCHRFAADTVHPNLYLLAWTAPPQMVNYASRESTLSSLLSDEYPPDSGIVGVCVYMFVYVGEYQC